MSAQKRGWVFLSLWAIFILMGIIAKRLFDHPDYMVFFHLPAAVFLVIAWHGLSKKVRDRYQEAISNRSHRTRSGYPTHLVQ